jgi:hypothetical protein
MIYPLATTIKNAGSKEPESRFWISAVCRFALKK